MKTVCVHMCALVCTVRVHMCVCLCHLCVQVCVYMSVCACVSEVNVECLLSFISTLHLGFATRSVNLELGAH